MSKEVPGVANPEPRVHGSKKSHYLTKAFVQSTPSLVEGFSSMCFWTICPCITPSGEDTAFPPDVSGDERAIDILCFNDRFARWHVAPLRMDFQTAYRHAISSRIPACQEKYCCVPTDKPGRFIA